MRTEKPDFTLSVIHPGGMLGPGLNGEARTSLGLIRDLMNKKMPAVP